MSKKIILSRGYSTIIDDEDYDRVSQYKWHIGPNHDDIKAYAKTRINRKTVCLHRFILNIVDKNIQVDHINGDPLDNRKSNLRSCSRSENQQNRNKKRNSKSKYKGVSWRKGGKWVASIQKNSKSLYLGYYSNEEEAAKAYNKTAQEMFGEFAKLNVIEENNDQKDNCKKKDN